MKKDLDCFSTFEKKIDYKRKQDRVKTGFMRAAFSARLQYIELFTAES
jgi:hypothetical protein